MRERGIYGAVLGMSLLAFILFAIYILSINQEVLYTAHNHSEFLYGQLYFTSQLSRPFGLIQYVGAWFTTLCYKPVVGSVASLCIWMLTFLAGCRAFRLQGGSIALMLLPIACLLTSIVDLGYWVYVVPVKGYWFSQSIGYLIALLLLWVARCTPRRWHWVWYLVGLCIYPLLGWFALLFVLCLSLSGKVSWRELVAVVVILFAPFIWQPLLYATMRMEDVMMAGFPHISNLTDSSEHLETPFWALGIVTVAITLLARFLSRWFVPVLCSMAGIAFTSSQMYSDPTYIDEMKMVRYAESDDWQSVLQVAAANPRPTSTMVMLKNAALIYEGGLLDRSFGIGSNIGYPAYNPDSVHVSILEIASPLLYYHYGQQNEAIRLSYECAVQNGFSPFFLKMLARSTQATGELQLRDRFLAQLHRLPYYGDWQPAPVAPEVVELQNCYDDEITGVENSENYLVNLISQWHGTTSKLASEQALFYAMMRRDSRRFWTTLRRYVKLHEGEEFPVHAQEAYIMYMDKAPEEKRMMIPVSQEIYDRYKRLWTALESQIKGGANKEEVAERLFDEYGDTYWYYNLFARKIYY